MSRSVWAALPRFKIFRSEQLYRAAPLDDVVHTSNCEKNRPLFTNCEKIGHFSMQNHRSPGEIPSFLH